MFGQGWYPILVVSPFHGGHQPTGELEITQLSILICPTWMLPPTAQLAFPVPPDSGRLPSFCTANPPSSRPPLPALDRGRPPTHRRANHRSMHRHNHSPAGGTGVSSRTRPRKVELIHQWLRPQREFTTMAAWFKTLSRKPPQR
jgi:hypothetical protein